VSYEWTNRAVFFQHWQGRGNHNQAVLSAMTYKIKAFAELLLAWISRGSVKAGPGRFAFGVAIPAVDP
jgi:hypothetical protein